MKYYAVQMNNGYCGHDEEFVIARENFSECELLELYTYIDGSASIKVGECYYDEDEESYDDDIFEYDEYIEMIWNNSTYTEISEEEFNRLVNEEDWDVR